MVRASTAGRQQASRAFSQVKIRRDLGIKGVKRGWNVLSRSPQNLLGPIRYQLGFLLRKVTHINASKPISGFRPNQPRRWWWKGVKCVFMESLISLRPSINRDALLLQEKKYGKFIFGKIMSFGENTYYYTVVKNKGRRTYTFSEIIRPPKKNNRVCETVI